MPDTDLGAWLRRKGLMEEHLRQWREALAERASAVFAPREPRVSAGTSFFVPIVEVCNDYVSFKEPVVLRYFAGFGRCFCHYGDGG